MVLRGIPKPSGTNRHTTGGEYFKLFTGATQSNLSDVGRNGKSLASRDAAGENPARKNLQSL